VNWLPRLVARIPATVHAKLLGAFLTIVVLLIALGVVGLQVLSHTNRRAENLLKRQERIAAYHQFQHDTTLLPSWSWNERTLEATLRQLERVRYELDQLQLSATDDAELLALIRDDYDRFLKVIGQLVELFTAGNAAEARRLQLTQGSPLARPGRAGLARNAAVVLGNVGGRVHLRVLHEVAGRHDSPLVREAARWAAERIEARTARDT